jgi:hypothetical protein
VIIGSIGMLSAPAGGVVWGPLLNDLIVIYFFLVAGIYLVHLSAAWLGMIYRDKRLQFNWLWQHHERPGRQDTLAKLREMRRQGDPRLLNRRRRPAQAVKPVAAPKPVLPIESPPPKQRGFDPIR